MKFEKKKKPVTKKMWKFLGFLPQFMRKKIIRSKFEVDYNLSDDYVFKQAETVQEIEEALHIVYENYTNLGYIDQKEVELHFNAFLCLPTTTILVVKYKEEVIGTMSIVADSSFGLPTETTWDLSKIRSKYKNIAEISSLSIKKTHKSSKGHILLTLCKLMWEYCTETLKNDCVVMAGTQEVESFYTDLLMFEKVTSKTGQEHKLVKGNKSTCCYLDMIHAKEKYRLDYEKGDPKIDLHHFFMVYKSPRVFLPQKHISLQGLHLKKNTAMIQILEKFPALNEMFTPADKMKLSNLDPLEKMDRAMNFENMTSRVYPRVSVRSMDGFLYHAESSLMIDAKLVDVSNQGIGIKLREHLKAQKSDKFVLIFDLEGEPMSIHCSLQWARGYDCGFVILEKSRAEWLKFVSLAFEEINLPLDYQRAVAIKKAA